MKVWVVVAVSLISSALPASTIKEEGQHPWSRVYKKLYSSQECVAHAREKELLFERSFLTPFTQLVVCFNAERPQDGQFEFFLRAHTQGKRSDEWQPWIKIAAWSDSNQKSFGGKNVDAKFEHVRFEMQLGLLGDGFQVRVEAIGKASLEDVKGLFVCASDFRKFRSERPYLACKELPSVRVQGVPKKSQKLIDHPRIGALCSPTTLSMVVEFLTGEPVDPLETARNVYDEGLDAFGHWPFCMAYGSEKTKGAYSFYVARLSSFSQLHAMISHMPVGLSVRGNIKGARKPYPNGHLLVVVGYDAQKKQVICFDPAFDTLDKVEVAYDIAEFLPAWERSNRLIYRAVPRA